jgi:hypothetical protein
MTQEERQIVQEFVIVTEPWLNPRRASAATIKRMLEVRTKVHQLIIASQFEEPVGKARLSSLRALLQRWRFATKSLRGEDRRRLESCIDDLSEVVCSAIVDAFEILAVEEKR